MALLQGVTAESFLLDTRAGEREERADEVLRCVRPSDAEERPPAGVPAPGLEPVHPRATAPAPGPVRIEGVELPWARRAALRGQVFEGMPVGGQGLLDVRDGRGAIE